MNFIPEPDHDWVDVEFLVFCGLGLSVSVYEYILCGNPEETDQDEDSMSVTCSEKNDIVTAKTYSSWNQSNNLYICAYHVYNDDGSSRSHFCAQISALYRDKTEGTSNFGAPKRKGALLYLLVNEPLRDVLSDVTSTGHFSQTWIRDRIDWNRTYHHALLSYIEFEMDFQNIVPTFPKTELGRTYVSKLARLTNIASLLCRRIFLLECESWLKTTFDTSEIKNTALTLKFFFFNPASPISLLQLQSVYVQDFDYCSQTVVLNRSSGDSHFVVAFRSFWYLERNAFTDFCKYLHFRQHYSDTTLNQLYKAWRSRTTDYSWMGQYYVDILSDTSNCLWSDIATEYRKAVLYSNCSEWHSEKQNNLIKGALGKVDDLLKAYTFPDFYYYRYNLSVSTDFPTFLAYKLCTYHQALFQALPPKKNVRAPLPPLDIKTFNKRAGISVRRQGKSLNLQGRYYLCVSAAEHTLFSNAHGTEGEENYVPCPAFVTQKTNGDGLEARCSAWGVSCNGDPKYYGPTKKEAGAFEAFMKDLDLDQMIEDAQKQDNAKLFISKHLTLILRDVYDCVYQPTPPHTGSLNCHEILNPFLSCSSIPFDLDFKNVLRPFSFDELITISEGFLQAVRIFVHIIRRDQSHKAPISGLKLYAFKSSCCDDNDQTTACVCKEKIGLRFIVQLPDNVLIANIRALKSCSDLLLSLLRSHFETVSVIEANSCNFNNVIDLNVWEELKTLRLPFAYKEGNKRQLFPFFTFDEDTPIDGKTEIKNKLRSLILEPSIALTHRDQRPVPSAEEPHQPAAYVLLGIPDSEEECSALDDFLEEEQEVELEPSSCTDLVKNKSALKESARQYFVILGEDSDDRQLIANLQRNLYLQLKQSKFKLNYLFYSCKLKEDASNTSAVLRYKILTGECQERFSFCLQEDKNKRSRKVLYSLVICKTEKQELSMLLMCKCFACHNNVPKCVLRWNLSKPN